ncbi:MAG: CocE/NonD family hydrolase [Acidimicrobiales bacterium]
MADAGSGSQAGIGDEAREGLPGEVRDGMRISWDVPIPMDDGVVLRADLYRPVEDGGFPVILSYGPYAKGLSFQEGYRPQWEKMVGDHPEVVVGSTGRYQSWEVVDPERWVPHGYACLRIDSRGAGRSPGFLDPRSSRERQDVHDCVEWAGVQLWSNGRVGMCGISYYAINQWATAGLAPAHLCALVPWEGAGDCYRDQNYHGGIRCEFAGNWFHRQVRTVQHGLGDRGARSAVTGLPVAGPETLGEEELAANRADYAGQIGEHPLDDEWHRARSADWSKVKVPFLSAANWGGHALHARGNFEAFGRAASEQRWLEVHGESHWAPFYTDYALDLQRRFLDHFLKGEDNGWDRQPAVLLNVRHPGERFVARKEREWPLARTVWTRTYLDAAGGTLAGRPPAEEASVEYEGLGDGASFSMAPFDAETEITGPLAVKLFVSSSTTDADLFLVVRLFDASGDEVTFQGALDPNTPIAQGWLRASHRRLDPELSLPYRPFHTHDRLEPLTPGQVYELDVEIWPTCIVAPAGHRLVLTVRGKDYEYEGELSEFAKSFYYASRGVGPFTHADPVDRPEETFGGTVTVHTGGPCQSYLLLPVIPEA